MTEWELQACLEEAWSRTGVRLGAETLLLAGREVMTDWTRNDSRVSWNKPSIDFVALDGRGRLVAIELKNRLDTRGQTIAAAVQATSMALALAPTASWNNLERTRRRLLSGRLEGDLATAWTSTFGTPLPGTGNGFGPVRRLLVARSVRAAEVAGHEFGSAGPAELVALAERLGGGRLANRLRLWLDEPITLLPLEFLAVDVDHLEGAHPAD